MTFKIKIKAPATREAQIRSSIAASQEKQDFYDFRHERTELPRVRIPQDLLLYRMENFRTFTDQQEYLAKEALLANFFHAGQENETVQQIQHGLLATLAKRGRADSVVPVIDVLRTEKQREPLLITYRGVVVNGNRRLAAMRELMDEDEVANHAFNAVTCLVLPEDASPDDIIEVEAGLQGRPETKLDYDWIGDGQLIKRLFEIGWTERQMTDRLRRKPTEIRNSLAALTEANLYLKDWRNAEGQYTLVRDSEQFFKDLPSHVQKKDTDLANASRAIAWTLHDHRDSLNERLYAFNIAMGGKAADVLDRLSAELGISLSKPEALEDNGDFLVDIEESDDEVFYQPIVDLLGNEDKRQEAVETLIDICRTVIEEERGKKTGTVALKAIGAANARLMEVDLSRADPSSYHAIGRQLEQITSRVSSLTEQLTALAAKRQASGTDTDQ
ncbi:MAG: hypothetical protein P0Y64_18490 [Candidatus Sphingomonas colombiensis]|nr:hypothetical protein [Sphingomonas sp.]WEK43279.1 MAG: hypothetical protein P0Y64_18490 [Sphingomonas sp.]